MKITCNREQFAKAFGAAMTVVNAKSVKEVLQNVKMVADMTGVTLHATDMETFLAVSVEGCTVQFPGEVLLPAGRVGLILRESPDEIINFEEMGTEVIAITKGGEWKLPSANPDEYPSEKIEVKSGHHLLSTRFLNEAIKRTQFATDADSSRYALGGMKFEMEQDGSVKVVGTDGRRLAAVSGSGQSVKGHWTNHQAIVPTRASRVLQRSLPEDGEVKVAFDENRMVVESTSVSLMTRLVEGRYPGWRQVIPNTDDYGCDATVPVGAFASLIRQAAITVDTETKGLDFVLQGGTCMAIGSAATQGKSNVSMPFPYSGKMIRIKLDYRYLLDFLSVLDPASTFRIQLADASHAALLSTDGYQYVVMPMALER